MAKISKAVIPVAGLGTRMLPATKAIPKELLTVYDRPIIEHVVMEAVAGGIKDIILVTRSGKEAIENHFDAHYELETRLEKKGKKNTLGKVKNIVPKGVNIASIRQHDALGLGHAVLCAKPLLNNEPFAVLLPDVLVLDSPQLGPNYSFSAMLKAWERTKIGQIMVEQVEDNVIENYGIVDLQGAQLKPFESTKLSGLVEKPDINNAPSNLAVLGRYVLPSEILELLEKTTAGVGGEIQLTDALHELLRMSGLNAFLTDAGTFDCGSKEGFLGANLVVGMRDESIKSYLRNLFQSNNY